MKKLVLVLFTVAIASVNIMAQEAPKQNEQKKTPEERAVNITKRMTKELVLTPDQQTKVKELVLTRENEKEQKTKISKEERAKWDTEMKAILTPEQYQKLQEKKEEKKSKHHAAGSATSNSASQ